MVGFGRNSLVPLSGPQGSSAGLKAIVEPGTGPGLSPDTVDSSPGAKASVREVIAGPTVPHPSLAEISGNAT